MMKKMECGHHPNIRSMQQFLPFQPNVEVCLNGHMMRYIAIRVEEKFAPLFYLKMQATQNEQNRIVSMTLTFFKSQKIFIK
jgi:hypothetical protein